MNRQDAKCAKFWKGVEGMGSRLRSGMVSLPGDGVWSG
jgi:hypothetical protein